MISSKFLFFVISYANPLKIHLFYMKMFICFKCINLWDMFETTTEILGGIPEAVSTPYRYVKSPFSSFLLSRGVRFTERYIELVQYLFSKYSKCCVNFTWSIDTLDN